MLVMVRQSVLHLNLETPAPGSGTGNHRLIEILLLFLSHQQSSGDSMRDLRQSYSTTRLTRPRKAGTTETLIACQSLSSHPMLPSSSSAGISRLFQGDRASRSLVQLHQPVFTHVVRCEGVVHEEERERVIGAHDSWLAVQFLGVTHVVIVYSCSSSLLRVESRMFSCRLSLMPSCRSSALTFRARRRVQQQEHEKQQKARLKDMASRIPLSLHFTPNQMFPHSSPTDVWHY